MNMTRTTTGELSEYEIRACHMLGIPVGDRRPTDKEFMAQAPMMKSMDQESDRGSHHREVGFHPMSGDRYSAYST